VDASGAHGFEEHEAPADVSQEVRARSRHRGLHGLLGGKVQDDVDLVVTEGAIHERRVADLARDRDDGWDRVAVDQRARVEDDDAVARSNEVPDAEATDIAGAAGDENVQ
jgi:hypothetical protein